MSVNIAFSIMGEFKTWGNGQGYLEKDVVSSVVPSCKFTDLADLVEWMADPNRVNPCSEAYGFVPTTFIANDADNSKPRYERKGSNEIDKNTFFYVDVDNSKPSSKARLEKVMAKLDKAGVSYVIYSTRRHSDECHRFRVLFPIDMPVSRFDARKIGIYLNKTWFSGQADLKVYNSAQFLYLPNPGAKFFKNLSGAPLDVQGLMANANALIAKEPHLESGCSKLSEVGQQKVVANAVAACSLLDSVNDTSVRPEINIGNRDVFSPRWLELYQRPESHWGAMRTILGSVWRLTEGTLTYGEMRHIFDEVDATGGGYFARVHGAKKTDQLIKFFFTRPGTGANDNWKSILSAEDIGLTIDVVEAEPGQGKTYSAVEYILKSMENFVYAVPKIEDLKAIRAQIEQSLGVRPVIFEVHGKAGNDPVPSQLTQRRKDFDRWNSKTPIIVLTTHASLLLHNWNKWSDFNCIVDEVPETTLCHTVNIKNNPDILTKHIKVLKVKDGDCHKVTMSATGAEALKNDDFDDTETANEELLEYLSTKNSTMWIEAEQWKNRDERAITFFGMVSPEKLKGFKSVCMLGDEATKSLTLRTWAAKWGVKVNVLEAPVRPRKMPIGDRLTIRYFAEKGDTSLTLFREKQPDLLGDISDVISAEHPGHDILWTANDRFKAQVRFTNCTHVTPRTHGRNDLQHHTIMVWLAAMKPSTATGASVYGVCGMSYDEVVEWREYNPMYQFFMRGSPRKPDGTEPVIAYVYSRKQAEYIQRRMGGTLEYVGDKMGSGFQSQPKPVPLTENQRQQKSKWVRKMLAKGHMNWAEVLDTKTKRNVDPVIISHIEEALAKFYTTKKDTN